MAKEKQRSGADGAMELLGVGGFALFFGWMLITFYWLFAIFLQGLPTGDRDMIQLFIFIGIALGELISHFLGKRASYTPFKTPVLAIEAVFAAIVPLISFGLLVHAPIPTPLLCTANLLAGIGGGFLTVSWLDVCGRSKSRAYARFCSEALLGGGALFALAALMPTEFQPVFCLVYLALSVGLLKYTSENSDNSQAAPVSAVEHKPWKFAREVEPSFVAFGIVFGMTFVFLFNYGSHYVFIGLLATIPGALVLVVLSLKKIFLNITVLQRILLFMTVLACICIPFSTGYVQIVCAFLVIASWALFLPTTYAHLVRKSVELGEAAVFRQVPRRLLASALGFLIGWAVASATTVVFGAHSDAFTVIRLCTACLVVLAVTVFFPQSEHHDENADRAPAPSEAVATPAQPAPAGMSEHGVFEARCNAVAEMYQLSPRETDVLRYLAKGRNAAYIQNKLTISPHTVKSHIYSIYRKTDIHSQQSLMDFVEDYPVSVPHQSLEKK